MHEIHAMKNNPTELISEGLKNSYQTKPGFGSFQEFFKNSDAVCSFDKIPTGDVVDLQRKCYFILITKVRSQTLLDMYRLIIRRSS